METRLAGTATSKGEEGADFYLKYYKRLPDYYITKGKAEQLGWIPELGNLAVVAR